MIGKLGHEKGLAHLGSAHKEICPRIEQTVYHRRSAGVHLFVEVIHRHGRQIGRVIDPAYLPQDFLQISFRGLVFCHALCYTLVRFL
jgi:hypothetical protein